MLAARVMSRSYSISSKRSRPLWSDHSIGVSCGDTPGSKCMGSERVPPAWRNYRHELPTGWGMEVEHYMTRTRSRASVLFRAQGCSSFTPSGETQQEWGNLVTVATIIEHTLINMSMRLLFGKLTWNLIDEPRVNGRCSIFRLVYQRLVDDYFLHKMSAPHLGIPGLLSDREADVFCRTSDD